MAMHTFIGQYLPHHFPTNSVICLMISVNTSPTVTKTNPIRYKTLETPNLKCARTM